MDSPALMGFYKRVPPSYPSDPLSPLSRCQRWDRESYCLPGLIKGQLSLPDLCSLLSREMPPVTGI